MRKLKRTLSLPMLVFYGVGMILGAGIYSVIGSAAGHAGSYLWVSFLLAALCAGFTALSYAELSAMIPRAGSEYSFLRFAFPRLIKVATASGVLMAFSEAVTAGAVALAFGQYLQQLTPLSSTAAAVAILIFFTGLNLWGTRESSWINAVMTIIEISGLILFVILAQGASAPPIGTDFQASGILAGATLILFAYLGFEDITNLTEDTQKPARNVPRAIFWSLGISAGLYILVSLAATRLLSPEALAQSTAPLMDAASKASPQFGRILGFIALISTANTVLITLLAASRTLFGMARDQAIPSILARLNARHTPTYGSLAVLMVAAVMTLSNSIEMAAGLASCTTLVNFVMINLTVIVLRVKAPKVVRPFRIPLSFRGIPISAVLGALTGLTFLVSFIGPLLFR